MDRHAARGFSLFESPAAAASASERFKHQLNKKYPTKNRAAKMRHFLAIAASVLLILGIGVGYFISGMQQEAAWVADAAWQVAPDQALSTTALAPSRNQGQTAQETLEAAALAYQQQDYSSAATAFRTYLTTAHSPKSEVLLYLGHAELQFNPSSAVSSLQQFLQDNQLDKYYQDLAHWYLAWAHIRLGAKQEAIASLQQITDSVSPLLGDAQQLLVLLSEDSVELGR